MTERIDHAAQSAAELDAARLTDSSTKAAQHTARAQVLASLAIAEQLRIGNLLAMAQYDHEVDGDKRVYTSEEYSLQWRADAAVALGLVEDQQ